jgi:hypothetical protein
MFCQERSVLKLEKDYYAIAHLIMQFKSSYLLLREHFHPILLAVTLLAIVFRFVIIHY